MIKIPEIVRRYYPELLWKVDTAEKILYLTFDDGPTESITDWTLDLLSDHKAKGTFFCIGKNVKKLPQVYRRILSEGHAVGNHTYDHKKGWESKNFDYMRSVMKCANYVDSELFRPPYGRIKKTQIKSLAKRFKIVMWDVLSEDYNAALSGEKCFEKVLHQSGAGSIIVFHDSKKAAKNLQRTLPMVLEHYGNLGFRFKSLS